MRWVVVSLVLALGCDGAPSTNPDGDITGDGGDDPDGLGPGQHNVKLTLTNRPNNAAMFSFVVAYQDGSAPWQVAPAPNGDVYTLPINAPSYGVAFTCAGNVAGTTTTQLRTVTEAHFAIGERTELTFDVPARCTDRAPATVTLSGTVTNRPFSGVLVVQFGTRAALVGTTSGNFSLQTPPGTHDLIVTQAMPEGNGEFYTGSSVRIANVTVTGPSTRTINFAGAQEVRVLPVYINDFARAVATTTLYTDSGTQVVMTRESSGWESDLLHPAQSLATDIYDQAIAVANLGSGATITTASNNPQAQTWVAPAPLGAVPTSIPTKMPYLTLESTWTAYGNTVGYTWNATQQLSSAQCGGNIACTIAWTALLSPGVTGSSPGYRMPDLAAVAGWKQSFQFSAGAPIVGGVTATTSSAGSSDFPTGIPANGTKRTFVRTDYSVTP